MRLILLMKDQSNDKLGFLGRYIGRKAVSINYELALCGYRLRPFL